MRAYRRTRHICENYPQRRRQGCLALAPVWSGIGVGGCVKEAVKFVNEFIGRCCMFCFSF